MWIFVVNLFIKDIKLFHMGFKNILFSIKTWTLGGSLFLTTDPTFHHLSSVEYYPISLDIWEDISLESSKSCYFSYLIYDLWDLVRSLTLLIFLPNWQGIGI